MKLYISLYYQKKLKEHNRVAKLENKSKDNPRLEQRLLKDGQISLSTYQKKRVSKFILDGNTKNTSRTATE